MVRTRMRGIPTRRTTALVNSSLYSSQPATEPLGRFCLLLRTRSTYVVESAVRLVGSRAYAAAAASGDKSKKGSEGGAANAPEAPTLSKGVKSITAVGANMLKDGSDPKVPADRLWHLLDKRLALSELQGKDVESLPCEDLKGYDRVGESSKDEGK